MSGMQGGMTPMDPQQAARNRRVIISISVAFVMVSLFVLVWGMFVTSGVRAQAAQADRALRSVGWAVLAYAQQHHGAFPTSDAALASADLGVTLPEGQGWPRTQQVALEGAAPMPLQEATGLLTVTWAPTSNLAPALAANGMATGIGTVDMVNEWIKSFARAQIAAPATAKPKGE